MHADGRCANKTINPGTKSGFVTELASLDVRHLYRQAYLFGYTPSQCRACAAALGHALPDDCMRQLVKRNLRASNVSCVVWSSVLPPNRTVDLLMVDAEGHEADVLTRFPFRTTPVLRVRFEAKHLSSAATRRIHETLTAAGLVRRTRAGGDETWEVARLR